MFSGNYYLQAVQKVLHESFSAISDPTRRIHNVRKMPDNRPFPGCGNVFVGLRIGSQIRDRRVLPALSEHIEIIAAVTVRTTTAPTLDVGNEFYVRDDGQINFQASIHHVCREIINLVHQSDTLLGYVQEFIEDAEGSTAQPVTNALEFINMSPEPQIVGSNHFTETNEGSVEARDETGLLSIITFGGGERLT